MRQVPIPPGRFRIGLLAGELGEPAPDVFAALTEDELALWESGA